MTYKLMPETIESIRRCAREAHQSQSEYVEAAVREKLEAELKRSGEDNQPEKNQGEKLAGETSDSLLPEARDKAKSTSKAGGSPYRKDHKQPQIDPVQLLNHLLEQNGLSRKDLAQVLGLDVSGVARILEGTCPITPEHAVRLGERFKLRPALFLSLEYRGRRDSVPTPHKERTSNDPEPENALRRVVVRSGNSFHNH